MATLTWTTTSPGFWNGGANWSPSQVPGAGDTVVFDGTGGDLSFVSGITIQGLSLNDPTALITATGLLSVTGSAVIQAGTLTISELGDVRLANLINQGQVLVGPNADLLLTGSYSPDSIRNIAVSQGTVTRSGTLALAGRTIDVTTVSGKSVNETILGGTLVSTGTVTITNGVLDGVTVLGTLATNGATIRNDITVLSADGKGRGSWMPGSAIFEGDNAIDHVQVGAPRFSFSPGGGTLRSHGTLTLGQDVTLGGTIPPVPNGFSTGSSLITLEGTNPFSRIINHGSIVAAAKSDSGKSASYQASQVTITVANFDNEGLITLLRMEGNADSRMNVQSSEFRNAATGVIKVLSPDPTSITPALSISAKTHFVNDGVIETTLGTTRIDTLVEGAGTITVANNGTLDLNIGVVASQTVGLGIGGTVSLSVPSLFLGTLTGLTQESRLILDGSVIPDSYASGVLTLKYAGGQSFGIHVAGATSLSDFIVNTGTGQTTITTTLAAPCFAAGTMIRTDRGDVPVEALSIGDHVRLASGALRPIAWIGHRDVDCAHHPDPSAVWPVRVATHAFGPGQPVRDLFLSPDHAIHVDDVLIPVKHLVNGRSIAQVPVARVSYFHVELDHHDVILAENLPVESYLDTGDRDAFANTNGPIHLFPRFGVGPNAAVIRDARAFAPLVITGPILDQLRARLGERATLAASPLPIGPIIATLPRSDQEETAHVAPRGGRRHRRRRNKLYARH